MLMLLGPQALTLKTGNICHLTADLMDTLFIAHASLPGMIARDLLSWYCTFLLVPPRQLGSSSTG